MERTAMAGYLGEKKTVDTLRAIEIAARAFSQDPAYRTGGGVARDESQAVLESLGRLYTLLTGHKAQYVESLEDAVVGLDK